MKFPIVIHKDDDSDFGVTIPDLPGCFTLGETFEDALDMAVEAAELHLEGYQAEEYQYPIVKSVEEHMQNPEYAGGVWAIINVDISKLSGKAKRINVTIPENILSMIDAAADSQGESRSGFLTHAAVEYISHHS